MDFGSFDDDNCWDEGPEDDSLAGPGSFNFNDRGFRNRQYSNAYGDYRGGYGPAPFRQGPPGPPGPFFGPPHGMGMFPSGPRPMGPPTTILGRGFGPGGPKLRAKGDAPAIRYLVRCGIPKHNLKNLPNALLDLIEPQYCGLCGHSFDSFALSRVHYISRNHQKSVKKFLSQNNTGSGNPQEAPLRARELYCELCDVQITSKVHAESHYKGKSHHAVVEGRKNPKNPTLLQPGMERRLHQLIRREKKFLNKAAETTEKEEVEVKDVKPIQPELYCEICNTNVTCSEQMTAHLNGKRHLAKEKNYILKSMRGEIDTCKTEETAEVENPDADVAVKEEEWQEHWE